MKASLALVLGAFSLAHGFYSVHFMAGNNHETLRNTEGHSLYKNELTTNHVADLYSRVAGLPSILSEEKVEMPALDMFEKKPEKVLIIEVQGASSLHDCTELAASASGPSATEVSTAITAAHGTGVKVDIRQVSVDGMTSTKAMQQMRDIASGQPAFILQSGSSRRLQENGGSNSGSKNAGPSEFEITQFQIVFQILVLQLALLP